MKKQIEIEIEWQFCQQCGETKCFAGNRETSSLEEAIAFCNAKGKPYTIKNDKKSATDAAEIRNRQIDRFNEVMKMLSEHMAGKTPNEWFANWIEQHDLPIYKGVKLVVMQDSVRCVNEYISEMDQ